MQAYKQLSNEVMHTWVAKDAKRLGGSLGIDLGCGKMYNRPIFRTRRYVGVDQNADALAKGLRKFPDAIAELSGIGEYEPPEPADLIICTLVLENKAMAPERTVPIIKRALGFLAPGGAFLFNLGRQNLPYEEEVDKLLNENFETVRKSVYGRFGISLGIMRWSFAAPFARVLSRYPALNVPRNQTDRRIYYACENFRSVSASQ